MKLLFRQRFMTFPASYDIFDEVGATLYTVEGEFSFGRLMHVRSAGGNYLASVKQKAWAWMPTFEIYVGPDYAGRIKKEFSFSGPRYRIEYMGWQVSGDFLGFDYTVTDATGNLVAAVSKELFQLTDTYCIDVADPDNALHALLLVLAIDADKATSS